MAVFLRYILYAVICVCLGCGSRKVNLNKESLDTKTESSDNINQQSDKYGAISTQEEALNTNVKRNETVETTKTREYDKDTGKLTKEQETTKTGSYNETMINNTRTVKNTYWRQTDKLSIVVKTVTKTNWNTKIKSTSTDRNGLYWTIGIVAVIGLAFWLKPWVR